MSTCKSRWTHSLVVGLLSVAVPAMGVHAALFGGGTSPDTIGSGDPSPAPNPSPIPPLNGAALAHELFDITVTPADSLNQLLIHVDDVDSDILMSGVTATGAAQCGVPTTMEFGEFVEIDFATDGNAEQYIYNTTCTIETQFTTTAVAAIAYVTLMPGEGYIFFLLPMFEVDEVIYPPYEGADEDGLNLFPALPGLRASSPTTADCKRWYKEDKRNAKTDFKTCVGGNVGFWVASMVIVCGIAGFVAGTGSGGAAAIPAFLACMGMVGGTGVIAALINCFMDYYQARIDAERAYRRCLSQVNQSNHYQPTQGPATRPVR